MNEVETARTSAPGGPRIARRITQAATRSRAWIVAIALAVSGVILGISATGAPQCCDASTYLEEARLLAAQGWTSDWLLPWHNYGYPVFLLAIDAIGLGGRLGIGVVQLALLYLAAGALAFSLARCMRASLGPVIATVSAIALLPAAAWSGYSLTEGLVAPLLMLMLALGIVVCRRVLSGGTGFAALTVAATGLVSGLAWMVRPALLWVPAATGLLMLGLGALLTSRGAKRTIVVPLAFTTALAVVALPQWSVDGDVLKLGLAGGQSHVSGAIWRYATNLSGCGPTTLVFSPFTDDHDEATSPTLEVPRSPSWRVTAAAAHLVSGWDALPSPTYITSVEDGRWGLVTGLSGFVILGPILAAGVLWRWVRRPEPLRPESVALAGILALFALSQAALAVTATEFRFNLPGWLLAGTCLAFLTADGWWDRRRVGVTLAVGLAISAVVFVIGQMTLSLSSPWIACTTA